MRNIKNIDEIISNNENNHELIFRGCAYDYYDLVPTLARKLNGRTSFEQYQKYVSIVSNAANRGYKQIKMNGKVSDLSQHYGLSTNNLDWSNSIYVSLYFSFTSYINGFFTKEFDNDHYKKLNYNERTNYILEELRYKFNNHIYCLYKLNKNLLKELKEKYSTAPIEIIETDVENHRMKAQEGLLTTIDISQLINNSLITNSKISIKDSQMEILKKWLDKIDPQNTLEKCDDKYLWKWNGKLLLEKESFSLNQRERCDLQKKLNDVGAISTNLFPDFEGVKKNIDISENYNLLRDWCIAEHSVSSGMGFQTDPKDEITG
ncbi:FRG domain-containing protein [Fructilactobacillus cliffordii]|uniref:FRG domain-containing protein n=1 Tax=Fructilactobacillus cliffordii TaxID=2940299 RepID=A0A9Q8ZUF4_9LACO|nr:FRG domain-containing protein [Fructilactobacillus cliffordii]USS89478.1 FRG domain-containing protein [Fructilactobacillus cliffordii]